MSSLLKQTLKRTAGQAAGSDGAGKKDKKRKMSNLELIRQREEEQKLKKQMEASAKEQKEQQQSLNDSKNISWLHEVIFMLCVEISVGRNVVMDTTMAFHTSLHPESCNENEMQRSVKYHTVCRASS